MSSHIHQTFFQNGKSDSTKQGRGCATIWALERCPWAVKLDTTASLLDLSPGGHRHTAQQVQFVSKLWS